MIDLHCRSTPNGGKVAILLEECGMERRILPRRIGRGSGSAARS